MNSRLNQILAGILLIQLVVAAFMLWPRPTASSQGEPLLAGIEADQVIDITLTDSEGQTIRLAKTDGDWVLPEADDYPVQAENVSELLDKIVQLTADRLVAQTRSSHARLGVAEDDFQARIDLELEDGTQQTLYVGTSPTFGVAHVRVEGQDEVYLVSNLSAQDASVQATAWVDRTYFTAPREQIVALTLENPNGQIEFMKVGENWMMEDQGPDETVDQDSLANLLNRVSTVAMVRPLGTDEKPAYGLSDPRAVVVLTVQTEDEGRETHTLRVGAQDPEGNTYVLASSDSPYFVRVSEFTVQDLVEKGRDDFLVLPPTPTPEQESTPEG
jgi:hypothetical protein